MRRVFITTYISLFFLASLLAQNSNDVLEGNHDLKDRYYLMKSKSQTYNDYKVIKETVLDGFWKITTDSMKRASTKLSDARTSVAKLENELKSLETKVAQTDLVLAEAEYDRTHISMLGIPFTKGFFLTLSGIVTGTLLLLLITSFSSVRILRRSNKEKDLTNFGLTSEFDEFRKKALEKEMKISRELQNERNKLQSMLKA